MLAAVLAFVLVVAGVGTYVAVDSHRAAEHKAAVAAAKKRAAAEEKRAAAAKAAAEVKDCQDALEPYLDSLTKIASAWSGAGINESDLSDWAQNASYESDRVDMNGLSDACGTIKDAADEALLSYNSVDTDWNDCIYGDNSYTDCTGDLSPVDFDPMTDAGTTIDEARDALRAGRAMDGDTVTS